MTACARTRGCFGRLRLYSILPLTPPLLLVWIFSLYAWRLDPARLSGRAAQLLGFVELDAPVSEGPRQDIRTLARDAMPMRSFSARR